jgi:glutaredoxin
MRPQVTLYTKPGCRLCDEARAEMLAAGADQFELREVNITTDTELYERYKHDIPVVLIEGTEVFRHRLTTGDFRRALARCR